ncbi:MAG: SH3 domain-containing protein, partial [Bdellovibrionales bacterium]
MRLFLLFVVLFPCIAFAQDAVDPFRSTAYPLPRFAALASNEIYVRAGPGKQYPVQWVFKKAGLPVEIVLEFDHWRKIKDYEGASGWVHKSLLSGRRTAIVKPLNDGLKKENMPLFSNENIESKKL